MRKIERLFKNGLWAVLAAGLLVACASGAGPAALPPVTPVLTVTPLPRTSPVFIPTVTSGPADAASSAGAPNSTGAGTALTPTVPAAPAQPLFKPAPGDSVTVTHVFSAGTEERQYDNQTVRVAAELTLITTYQISGTTEVQTTTQDQTAASATASASADTGGGPAPITPASLQAAADKLGFAIRAPGWLPPGYAPATAGTSRVGAPGSLCGWSFRSKAWARRRYGTRWAA